MEKEKKADSWPWWTWGVPIALLGLWIASYPILREYVGKADGPGTFGDSFGAVNALFSAFALLGVIAAIFLQKKELEAQREELKLTREELSLTREEIAGQRAEMEGQKKQLEMQNRTMIRQEADNNFFTLMRFYHDVISSIEVKLDHNRTLHGHDAISRLVGSKLNGLIQAHCRDRNGPRWDHLRSAYTRFFDEHAGKLAHYFRLVETILFTLKDDRDRGESGNHIRIVKSILSDPEKVLLWYHIACDEDAADLKALILKFSVLEDISKSQLLNEDDAKVWPEFFNAEE